MTLLFSCAIDFFMGVWSFVTPDSYFWQLVPLVCGTTFIALGVSLQGIANVLMLPGEGCGNTQPFSKQALCESRTVPDFFNFIR